MYETGSVQATSNPLRRPNVSPVNERIRPPLEAGNLELQIDLPSHQTLEFEISYPISGGGYVRRKIILRNINGNLIAKRQKGDGTLELSGQQEVKVIQKSTNKYFLQIGNREFVIVGQPTLVHKPLPRPEQEYHPSRENFLTMAQHLWQDMTKAGGWNDHTGATLFCHQGNRLFHLRFDPHGDATIPWTPLEKIIVTPTDIAKLIEYYHNLTTHKPGIGFFKLSTESSF